MSHCPYMVTSYAVTRPTVLTWLCLNGSFFPDCPLTCLCPILSHALLFLRAGSLFRLSTLLVAFTCPFLFTKTSPYVVRQIEVWTSFVRPILAQFVRLNFGRRNPSNIPRQFARGTSRNNTATATTTAATTTADAATTKTAKTTAATANATTTTTTTTTASTTTAEIRGCR